ncbi:hypothetical protein [Herbihabitans rhizosphaerae]|uniref:hypothetical protein n=1 Tax=Herbihabitans rhizosphaerae TaxID=1872711 RepID=UPI00102C4B23|nr:hypothetical protein [Herbihabitans rhizosphaerae]
MRSLLPRITAGTSAAGIVLIVLGTFLDWTRSGSVYRDSYQSIGVLKALDFVEGTALTVLLDVWMAIVPVATVAVIVYAFGLRRNAAGLLSALSVVTGTVSVVAAIRVSGGEASLGIAGTGPTVTLTGSVLALLGATGVLVRPRPGEAARVGRQT